MMGKRLTYGMSLGWGMKKVDLSRVIELNG